MRKDEGMNAPEESVRAVEEALGCERSQYDQCGMHQFVTWEAGWTDRGCPVAVASADAAVAALNPTSDDLVSHDGTLVRRIASASWDLPIE